jgi:uncharacterized protein (DUF1015 family)
MTSTAATPATGLSLAPFRALRPAATGEPLARRLSPPYDVITPDERGRLLAGDPDNVVGVILPDQLRGPQAYAEAAATLQGWVDSGAYAADAEPALYVYELRDRDGAVTRGLVGAVELHDPADGVILPHENTMAGPVADRLALMTATEADLEPIYLVYSGDGPAAALVREIGSRPPLVEATTPDGVGHRLWSVTDPAAHALIADDLATHRAVIADGHHRYATYRERQRLMRAEHGPGPWDRGLALLVDTSRYGPQVHPIHRTVPDLALDTAADALLRAGADVREVADLTAARDALTSPGPFVLALADGIRQVVVTDPAGALQAAAERPGEIDALSALDVTILHRAVIEQAWGLTDDEHRVGYAHSVDEALAAATAGDGIAVLIRATPVADVAAVAEAGGRMPRKSTLFTPKPASGLLMRRFADQLDPI